MNILVIIMVAGFMVGLVLVLRVFTSWGRRWGATPAECARRMIGDAYLDGGPATRISMTRAVSLNKPPQTVWPWLAQLGRGAGWYSIERLDNGGKTSARHIVSWIPAPQLGDAAAIGYLRYLEPGRELVWWLGGEQWLGSRVRMVVNILVMPRQEGSRLIIRISGDAAGSTARLAIGVFQLVDTIMARRQLLGIKERVERYGARPVDLDQPETGRVDQYQLYEIIYASGKRAGVAGKEKAASWRRMAIEDKILVQAMAEER